MKMISPDGKISIDAHSSNIENLLNKGWKEEATNTKSSSKKEVKENGGS